MGLECPNGLKFDTLKEMLKHYEIEDSTYRRRLKRGMSEKEALGIIKQEGNIVCPKGNKFQTISEMTRFYGVGEGLYRQRRSRGWTMAEALNLDVKERQPWNCKAIECSNDKSYESIADLCRSRKIGRGKVRNGLKKGLSVEDIIDSYNSRQEEITCPKGIKFESVVKMCKHYNVSRSTYMRRMKHGWTKAQALNIESKPIATYSANGKEYENLSEIAVEYGLNYSYLCKRVRDGESIDTIIREHGHKYSYDDEIFGVAIKNIVAAHGRVSIAGTTRANTEYILNTLLWENPKFMGLTDDGMVVLKTGEGFKLIKFKEYIEHQIKKRVYR